MEKGEGEEVMVCGVRFREVRNLASGWRHVLGINGGIQIFLGLISYI